MSVDPSAAVLLAAATRFLKEDLLPGIEGAASFNLRVAINAIDLVRREIEYADAARNAEAERLRTLLKTEAPLDILRTRLCDLLAERAELLDDPQIVAHLRSTAIDRLAIDQPTYSSYLRATALEGDR